MQTARLTHLAEHFSHLGLLSKTQMHQRYAAILDALPTDAPVVLVLANERGPHHYRHPESGGHPHHCRLNKVLRCVAEGRENVILLDPADHINGPSDLIDLNHFKRPIYHRMYQTLHDLLAVKPGRQVAEIVNV